MSRYDHCHKKFQQFAWAGGYSDPLFVVNFMHRGRDRQEWEYGPRRRRGEIKFILLELLAEEPQHGYELIKKLENRSKGCRPFSAGSVYPTLQMLEDGGYVSSQQVEDKRVYGITEKGRELLSTRPETSGVADSAESAAREELSSLKKAITELNEAIAIIARSGNTERVNQVKELVIQLKREIYKMLAQE